MKKLPYLIIGICCLFVYACSNTPSEVIKPHDMALLLADIHRSEGVVEMNRRDFSTDTSKQALMEAVYRRHNVTQQMVDTSFDWYGHHIEEYIKVYTEVIDILQNEIDQTDAVAARIQMAAVGDSADAWIYAPRYILSSTVPSRTLNINLIPDDNWERGDNYTLNFNVINSRSPVKSLIGVEYADGQIEWVENILNDNGKVSFTIISDSTKDLSRVFASILPNAAFNETVFLDSLSLMRTRANRQIYSRRYSQKKIMPKVREKVEDDTLTAQNETKTK